MPGDWLTANETYQLVRKGLNRFDVPTAIGIRAHAGLIRCRAERFIQGSESFDNVEIPKEFWWAEGNEALEQNWTSGDFSTFIDRRVEWKAFGVQFFRSGVEKLVPLEISEDWVGARRAVLDVAQATGTRPTDAVKAIITYARTGHIKGKALTMRQTYINRSSNPNTVSENVIVPDWFWDDPSGKRQIAANWQIGLFSAKRNVDMCTVEVELTGMEFNQAGLQLLVPSLGVVKEGPTVEATAKPAGGRPLSKLWPDWVAELAVYIHEEGLPPGEGTQGQEDVINTVADRLARRGIEAPPRSTVQPAVQAVLARIRLADN